MNKNKTIHAIVFSCAALLARADITTFIQSKWQAADGANLNGNFSETAHWDSGVVPMADSAKNVNGYILESGTYSVTNDQEATVAYLDIRSSGSDKVTFVVEEPLAVEPARTNNVTIYDPDKKTVREKQGPRGLWLDGTAEVQVSKGSSLTIDTGTESKSYSDRMGGNISNGARILVDGGSFSLTNFNWCGTFREVFYVAGTETATSRIDIVNGSRMTISQGVINSYGGGFWMFDYSLLNVVDSFFEIDNQIYTRPRPGYGPTQTGPGPVVQFSGNSVFQLKTTSNKDPLFTSGTYRFSGNSIFSNATANVIGLIPERAEAPCVVEFSEHASANFNKSNGGSLDALNIAGHFTGVDGGVTRDVNRASRSYLIFDSDGELLCGNQLTVGNTYGYGELTVRKGSVKQMTNYGLSIGRSRGTAYTDVAVTGVVNVVGGLLYVNAPSGNSSAIYGLRVGDGTVTSDKENTNYFYGELNVSGGQVDCTSKMAIGLGTARGILNQTGGEVSGGSLILGLRGGTGECRITGGTYSSGIGDIWIGGVPTPADLNLNAFGENVPETRDAAKGLLLISNATFTQRSYGKLGVKVGYDGQGTIEIGEGGDMYVPYVYTDADRGAYATFQFDFSSTTSGVLRVMDRFDIAAGAKLVVNARNYKGEDAWFPLVKFNKNAKYGSVQGVANADRFTDVVRLGCVKVEQNPPNADVRPGIWAYVRQRKGCAVYLR